MVYLTTAYPFYFALNASQDDSNAVVFEIDAGRLKQDNFYPDEDIAFLIQRIEQQSLVLV